MKKYINHLIFIVLTICMLNGCILSETKKNNDPNDYTGNKTYTPYHYMIDNWQDSWEKYDQDTTLEQKGVTN